MKEIEKSEGMVAIQTRRPIIYVRSAVADGDKLQERTEDARELARVHGLDVADVDVIAEVGSGTNIGGRVGIQKVLAQVTAGEVCHVVTPELSHLARRQQDLHSVLRLIAGAEVALISGSGMDTASADPGGI